MKEKPLPVAIDAERAVLGSIFLDRDSILWVADKMDARYCYQEKHAWIYEAQKACYDKRVPPDMVTVADELRRMERLDTIGGPSYLMELEKSVPTAVHIEYYVNVVRRSWKYRRLIWIGGEITRMGYDESLDEDEIVSRSLELIQSIDIKNDSDLWDEDDVYTELVTSYASPEQYSGLYLNTKLHSLDNYIRPGIEVGEVIVVAGRTGTGKSTFLSHMRMEAAIQGFQVLECSGEMSKRKLGDRMISALTRIPLWKFRRYWSPFEQEECIEAVADLANFTKRGWKLWDVAKPLETIRQQAIKRKIHDERPLVVMIDHIGLLPWPKGATDESKAIARMMPQIKAMARELGIIVIVAAQMNRGIEGREDDTPRLSDLYASDRIAQDSDRVLFLHLSKEDKERRRKAIDERISGIELTMMVSVEKNRDGPIGTAATRWLIDCYRLDG